MSDVKAKQPVEILREAIFICGDCPECGSDNWTDDGDSGECHSCGARFNATIPRQMVLASKALSAMQKELDGAKRPETNEEWQILARDHAAQAERLKELESTIAKLEEGVKAAMHLIEAGFDSSAYEALSDLS